MPTDPPDPILTINEMTKQQNLLFQNFKEVWGGQDQAQQAALICLLSSCALGKSEVCQPLLAKMVEDPVGPFTTAVMLGVVCVALLAYEEQFLSKPGDVCGG